MVGVSGGADSVALLWMLVDAGFRDLVVCHMNHRLRGEESDGDEAFVEALAAEMGLPCECGKGRVVERMEERGESMETAARVERQRFFAECAVKHGSNAVLLAHHADDQAETVLWNLMRGSRGLRGMREVSEIEMGAVRLEIIRPLLGVRSRELREWLAGRGKLWREDSSNREAVAVRNRLRSEVIPLLDEISGREFAGRIAGALEGARGQEELEAWAVKQADARDPQGRLHVPVLRQLPEAVRRAVVWDYLKDARVPDLDRALVMRVLRMIDAGAPPVVNLPGGRYLRRREGRIFIDPRPGPF